MWIILAIIAIAIVAFFLRRKSKANAVDLSVLPAQFVVVDVETTGLDSDKHQIIEIGAVKVNRDSDHHTTFQVLVKPNGKLPRKIAEMTGITTEMLEREGESLEVAIAGFLEFVGNLRLVAFNAPFDLAFLSRAAGQIEKRIENPVSDALDMARRAWPGRRSYRLVDLSRAGSLATKGNHRTLKDCQLTITVYCAAASKLKSVH
jgi:DNA polymerase III epsilon subunit family exonuclease